MAVPAAAVVAMGVELFLGELAERFQEYEPLVAATVSLHHRLVHEAGQEVQHIPFGHEFVVGADRFCGGEAEACRRTPTTARTGRPRRR